MSLKASKNLKMHLMDVVTAYLYGSLDNDIYMKLPEGLKMPGALKEKLMQRILTLTNTSSFSLFDKEPNVSFSLNVLLFFIFSFS